MTTTKESSYKYLSVIEYFYELAFLLYNAFRNIPSLKISPVRTVFFRQIYFAGIEAFNKVVVMGMLIGIVIITQIINLTGVGSGILTGKILIWIIVRELGPLFAAIIIIARSVTAISAELGSMNVQGEIESIEMLGINPSRYLIMPRIFAVALSAVMLTFYFEFASIFGGIVITSLIWGVPFEQYVTGILSALTIKELLMSVIKSLLFGFGIAAISCFHGLRVSQSITRIPQETTKATVQSLFFVFIFDGIITFILSI